MKREHIKNFDLIRCVCALLVIAYHFFSICFATPEYAGSWWGAYFKNGNWGETAVIVFFMLSGASLRYNYPTVDRRSIGKFYLKRLFGILPMYYISWIAVVICRSIKDGAFMIKEAPASLLLTLFGMDGYLGYLFPHSYYLIGEWFLGALILLYLLYPLLALLYRKIRIAATCILACGFLFVCFTNFFTIPAAHNLVTCIFGFWLGMLYIDARPKLQKMPVPVIALIVFAIFTFIHIPADETVAMHVTAVSLFIVLDYLGGITCKTPVLRVAVSWISTISYPLFLLHHVIIYRYMNTTVIHSLSSGGCIGMFIVTVIASVIAASVLHLLQ